MHAAHMTNADYQHFYGDDGIWKNTLKPELFDGGYQPPTATTVTIHHEQEQHAKSKDWHCIILHVRGFHGKGFMPTVRFNYGSSGIANGNVSYGITSEALQKAVDEGEKLLQNRQQWSDDLFTGKI